MEVKDIDHVVLQSVGNIYLEYMELTPKEIIIVKKNTLEEKSYLISLYKKYQEKNGEIERGKTYYK